MKWAYRPNITNAPLLSRNETTTITPAHTENSAEIRQRYEMPEPYLEPLALGRSPMFAAICEAIAVQPNTGLLHGTCWKEQVAQTLTPFVRPLTFIQAAG